MNAQRCRSLATLLCVVLLTQSALEARYTPSTGNDRFSREEEIQLGQQAAAETNRKMPILPDNDPLTKYVQKIGNRLAQYAPGDKWPYSFHVVNQKEINAFALPGGPVYVNLGTIQAADNEAQLAGVMAHEISHVVERHATRAATKQPYIGVLPGILGMLLGKGVGSSIAQLGAQFAVGSYLLKNSRGAESEADLVGTDIMYDAGYDPHQMAVFFEKLEAEGGSRGPQFLSDHPNPGNRSAAVADEVRTLPPKQNWVKDTAEFDRMRTLALKRKPLTAEQIAQRSSASPSSGALSAGRVPVSDTLRDLNHSAFQISYPDNWQVHGDANSAVTIAPQSCISQTAVACGAMINVFRPESPDESLDRSMDDLVANLRQANPDLRAMGSPQAARIQGVPAKSLELTGSSPVTKGGTPDKERDWLLAMRRNDGTLLYVIFVSPDSEYSNLRPTFEQMARSLQMK